MRIAVLTPFLILMAAAGCSTAKTVGVPPHHVLFVDTYGNVVDPTGALRCGELYDSHREAMTASSAPQTSKHRWEPCYGESTLLYRRTVRSAPAYIDDIFAEMEHFHRNIHGGEFRKLTIIIHGGLATNTGNLLSSRELAPQILADGEYPVFLVWQSNLWGSLVDAYFKVANGRNRGWGAWSFLAPMKVAGDLVDGVAKLPPNIYSHLDREVARGFLPLTHRQSDADLIYAELRERYEARSNSEEIAISKGPWCWKTPEGMRTLGKSFLLQPAKIVTMPFIEGMGSSAWQMMNRHVHIAFRNEDGKAKDSTTSGWPEQSMADKGSKVAVADTRAERQTEGAGAVSLFFRRLRREIANSPHGTKWEINLIGHSMGGIMLNEILRQFQDIPFSNIVYAASAASIEDYESAALPFLRRHRELEVAPSAHAAPTVGPAPEVWHLTLHPYAEVREEYAAGFVPSGSLLVWIDDYLANPIHFRERTAGRYSNLMLALPYTPIDLRPFVNVKTFGVGASSGDPQHHGGLLQRSAASGQFNFWQRSFWEPQAPTDEPAGHCPEELLVP